MSGPDPTIDELAAVVDALVTSAHLVETLREVRDDPALAARLGARSSWHPLGFAKLQLGTLPGSVVRLRLHLWTDDGHPVDAQDDPHSHRWRFASAVAWGGPLQVVHFEESSSGRDYHRFEYGPTVSDLTTTGPRLLRELDEFLRHRGELYRCERGRVHTIRPVDRGSLTTTLIARGPDAEASTPVYRRGPDPTIAERPALSSDDIRQLLDHALPAG